MQYILPIIITLIIVLSHIRRQRTYDLFIEGACEGFAVLKSIFPPLLAVTAAASMLRASGALDMLINAAAPAADFFGIPREVLPIAAIRPVSGGGALGILSELLSRYGADSFAGRSASVIMGATETTFYCVSVYYARTRVRSAAKILPIALLCDAVSVWAAVRAVEFFCT